MGKYIYFNLDARAIQESVMRQKDYLCESAPRVTLGNEALTDGLTNIPPMALPNF